MIPLSPATLATGKELSAAQQLPLELRSAILAVCDVATFEALRSVDDSWYDAATPSVIRCMLTTNGAARGLASDAPDKHLEYAIDHRLSIIARHAQRFYRVPSKIWDFDCAALSPDLGMLLGVSDGYVLTAFDLDDYRVNALFGNYNAGPIGWSADGNELICRDERSQLVAVEPFEATMKQFRVLPGSQAGSVRGWCLSWDRKCVAGSGHDGRNWVTSLETNQVISVSSAPSPSLFGPPV